MCLKMLKKYKRDYRSRKALHVSHSIGQDGIQAQYRIICHLTLSRDKINTSTTIIIIIIASQIHLHNKIKNIRHWKIKQCFCRSARVN